MRHFRIFLSSRDLGPCSALAEMPRLFVAKGKVSSLIRLCGQGPFAGVAAPVSKACVAAPKVPNSIVPSTEKGSHLGEWETSFAEVLSDSGVVAGTLWASEGGASHPSLCGQVRLQGTLSQWGAVVTQTRAGNHGRRCCVSWRGRGDLGA